MIPGIKYQVSASDTPRCTRRCRRYVLTPHHGYKPKVGALTLFEPYIGTLHTALGKRLPGPNGIHFWVGGKFVENFEKITVVNDVRGEIVVRCFRK